jgi:alkanesulfonate monooxygenase SsuD/methylene tetrahydromethanopterin reductase-like flavin-dependent oxidoreductase (luciferase family)
VTGVQTCALPICVGAGWYREEFEALGIDFATRGRNLDESLALLRDLWGGRPAAFEGEVHALPAGVIHEPTPVRRVPILVGGMSTAALRRAAAQDGWLALQRAGRLDVAELAVGVTRMSALAREAGRDPADLRVVLRVIASQGRVAEVARALPELTAAGVDEVVIDTDWDSDDDELDAARILAEARAALPTTA